MTRDEIAIHPFQSRPFNWLITLCFFLSGFAALLYETVWLRQFAIVLGTSEQALAVILASYMSGLALGAWVAAKWVGCVHRPAWTYGILELGIACCALGMPLGLLLVQRLQVLWFGGSPQPPAAGSPAQVSFSLVSCFGLILLPTAMMGATLPLLAKHLIHRNREVGPRLGMLYGINTFGASVGTLFAAFLLLPRLGLRNTTFVGAAINGIIFLLIYWLCRERRMDAGTVSSQLAQPATDVDAGMDPLPETLDRRYGRILWFATVAGAVAFAYEIVFTRMLSHILGGSIFAFATMLAGFLLGIALGSVLASRLATCRDGSVVAFAYFQCGAGLSALFSYYAIDWIAGWTMRAGGASPGGLGQVLAAVSVLLPAATCMGATFPLASRILARDETEAATSSARVYLWSTMGGIAGALVTGILLLPALGYHGTVFLAVGVNATVAILLAVCMKARFVHVAAGCLTLVLLILLAPPQPDRVLRISALDGRPIEGNLLAHKVGRSGTVVLFEQLGAFRFFTNGLPEAIVGGRGTQDPFASSAAWLGALPPLLSPNHHDSILIVGLGGGVAAAHVPPSVTAIDVFELEPAVVEANESIRSQRDRDPMGDPRVNIIFNDGRNGLALTSKCYDVIVSQPSHPWTAGASHLYTREFAGTARDRLNEGGIFLQWMNVDFIDVELFRSLTATLLDVFPHLRVYEPAPGNLLFAASDQPIRPEAIAATKLPMTAEDKRFYRDFGVTKPTHLFALLRVDEPELREIAEGAPSITDEQNLLAMHSPRIARSRDAGALRSFLDNHSPLNRPPEELLASCPTVDPLALGMRLMSRESGIDLSNLFRTSRGQADRILYDALLAKADGRTSQCIQFLQQLAGTELNDPRAAFMLLAYRRLGSFSNDAIDEQQVDRLSATLDSRYRALLDAVDALMENQLETVRRYEPEMATFDTDEIGYELAVRMRVLWRITDGGPDRMAHNREALDLIAEAMVVVGADALIPFRVAAAIGAEQPQIALACTVEYARSVVDRIEQGKVKDVQQLESFRSNLLKCRSMLDSLRGMPGLEKDRYRNALEYLDAVIAGRRSPQGSATAY